MTALAVVGSPMRSHRVQWASAPAGSECRVDGRRLLIVSPGLRGVRVYELLTGRETWFRTRGAAVVHNAALIASALRGDV